MANIPNSSLKAWNDGDVVHASDYSQDRSILQTAINDNYAKLILKYDKTDVDNLLNAMRGTGWTTQTIKANWDLIQAIQTDITNLQSQTTKLSSDGADFTGTWYNMQPSQIATSTVNWYYKSWTATDNQSVFQLTGSDKLYTPGSETTWVEVGGVPQAVGQGYTETDNKTITLAEGVPAGTLVELRYFLNNAASETPITNMVGFQENVAAPLAKIATFAPLPNGTDDTTAFSNVIDSCVNKGRLILLPGTYIVSSIYKTGINNLRIEALIPGSVTIQRKAGTYGNNSDGSTSGILTFANSSNILIKDIIFDGNKANAKTVSGVYATNVLNFYLCDNVLIDNITVINGHYDGLNFQCCNNQKVINSTFKDCGYCGLNIGGGFGTQTGATDVTIENNRFFNMYSGLIVSVYVQRADVKNNFFINSTCNFSQTVTQSKISGNKFNGAAPASDFGDSAISAITAEGDSELIIDGNDIMSSALFGIYVFGSYITSGPNEGLLPCNDVQITNNKVTGANQTGILASIGSPWTYNSTTHTATSASEANSTKGKNCLIEGNIVSSCTGSGIGIGLGQHVIVSDNQSFLNQLHGINLSGSDKVEIKNNQVFNNSKAGTDAYNGIDLGSNTVNSNILISDNEIFDDQATRTQRYGIMVNNSSANNVRVRDNVIYGNGGEIYSVVPLDPYTVVTATLQAGATAQTGYETPSFYRDGDNTVHLIGSVVAGTDLTQAMFILPFGYRPDALQRLITVANGTLGVIEIDTNGNVVPKVATASQYVNLTGLSFKCKPYTT